MPVQNGRKTRSKTALQTNCEISGFKSLALRTRWSRRWNCGDFGSNEQRLSPSRFSPLRRTTLPSLSTKLVACLLVGFSSTYIRGFIMYLPAENPLTLDMNSSNWFSNTNRGAFSESCRQMSKVTKLLKVNLPCSHLLTPWDFYLMVMMIMMTTTSLK